MVTIGDVQGTEKYFEYPLCMVKSNLDFYQ